MKMSPTIRGPVSSILLLLALIASSCGPNEGILKSGKEMPPPANVDSRTTFARELDAMQTADFRWVYVLRRKDGGKIDAEDRSVIKLQTTDANRRVAADDDKAFIIGSNVPVPPPNLAALYGRFAVEDHSPPPPPATNTNANAAK